MARLSGQWFPAKSSWMWDLPQCWQGWAVVVGWWLTLVVGVVLLLQRENAGTVVPLFAVAMVAGLWTICYMTGEPLKRDR